MGEELRRAEGERGGEEGGEGGGVEGGEEHGRSSSSLGTGGDRSVGGGEDEGRDEGYVRLHLEGGYGYDGVGSSRKSPGNTADDGSTWGGGGGGVLEGDLGEETRAAADVQDVRRVGRRL